MIETAQETHLQTDVFHINVNTSFAGLKCENQNNLKTYCFLKTERTHKGKNND